MKYLLIVLLLSLSGCKFESTHKAEADSIKKKAGAFCACRGGILELDINQYSSIDDTGYVTCMNGAFNLNVQDITATCGELVEEQDANREN